MISSRFKESNYKRRLVIGIDASSLRQGGGRTHLIELLLAFNPDEYGVERVIVWGGSDTLIILSDKSWLEKRNPPLLDGHLWQRSLWQCFYFAKEAREAGVDILFVPGGSYVGNYHPVVTMSQNMLPFEWEELSRYGWSRTTLKLLLLRVMQSQSFQKSDGVIFLSDYARTGVEKVVGKIPGLIVNIPHGVKSQFINIPSIEHSIDDYSELKPFRLLYVSIIDKYKHQWKVVEAVAQVRRKTGWPLTLDLVGPAYQPALKQLRVSMQEYDPNGKWVCYHGAFEYSKVHDIYEKADMAVWASSCETFGIILLEYMAAGLPIASSDRGPMPEILGDAGIYFDPENSESIANSLICLIGSNKMRSLLAKKAYEKAQKYSWGSCAKETFGFLVVKILS